MSPVASEPRRWARIVTVAGCVALILFYTGLNLWGREDAPRWPLWLLQCLPLVMFLPALVRGRLRAFQWLGFLILVYFVNGVLRAFTPGTALPGALEITLTVLVFGASVTYAHGISRRP